MKSLLGFKKEASDMLLPANSHLWSTRIPNNGNLPSSKWNTSVSAVEVNKRLISSDASDSGDMTSSIPNCLK